MSDFGGEVTALYADSQKVAEDVRRAIEDHYRNRPSDEQTQYVGDRIEQSGDTPERGESTNWAYVLGARDVHNKRLLNNQDSASDTPTETSLSQSAQTSDQSPPHRWQPSLVNVPSAESLAAPYAPPVNPRLPLAQITKQLEAQQARGDEELDIFRHNFTNFAMAYGEAGRRGEVDEKYVAERQNHMLNDFMDRRSRGGAPLSAELERQFRDMIPKGSSRIHRLTRFIERLRKPQSPGNP